MMPIAIISQFSETISLLVTICLLSIPAYTKYSGGTGQPNDPYQIATADDLILLGESSELLSGGQFVVENLPKLLYLEGVSGSLSFRDIELKATWLPKNFRDVVKVTVFEVDLTGSFSFGSQQGDNDKKHSTFKISSDKNGKISWDDANADGTKGDMDPNCEYFHNCMECQGTIKPSGVTSEVQFDITREKWRKI